MANMANIPLPMTALYAGMLGLILVILSMMVIRQRVRAKVYLFDGGDPQLGQAIRVQGNLTEHLPLTLILMAVVEINGAPDIYLHIVVQPYWLPDYSMPMAYQKRAVYPQGGLSARSEHSSLSRWRQSTRSFNITVMFRPSDIQALWITVRPP
jgi:hypothetical protein